MTTILKINLKGVGYRTEPIYVEGNKHDDIVYLIDEYYSEYDLPVELYDIRDIREMYKDENDLMDQVDGMIPINGGEYYIDGIDSVEELDELADEYEIKQAVLSNYLNVPFDDLNLECDSLYSLGGSEYLILSDLEADDATEEYIKNSLWAFSSSFLAEYCIIEDYYIAVKVIEAIQKEYEDGNDTLLALVDDIDDLIDDAISSDGRGNFLAQYDGEEIEHMNYYIYRIG